MSKPTVYKTWQREAILKFMTDNAGEVITVRAIEEYFRKMKTPIGIATIYRQLDELNEKGIVSKYTIDGIAGACYQYRESDESAGHAHMMCEGCGNLTDLDCDFLDNINMHLLSEHRFNVNPHKLVFYGKCKECINRNSKC